jgi:NAD+ synthase
MAAIETAARTLDLSLSETELERRHDHITSFIQSQYDESGAETAIIALSGGIDSTLTSHLMVDALGTKRVYGLVLPSTVNREENMSDAERVADRLLDIEFDVIEIEPLATAVLDAYPGFDASEREQYHVTAGNLRARLRAVLNYVAANHRNGIVFGTGNRSEAAVGYFTKYGDGAVDCHPIANLYKQQVRQLASYVGVPDDLVEKTPSAELWADQTDEDELGLGYDTLDSILALHVDGPLSVSATARELGIDESLVADVRAMHDHSAHKRRAPPGPAPLY